jgi:hypothetical protein
MVVDWALPIGIAVVAVLVVNTFVPEPIRVAFLITSFAFAWVPMCVLWVASGSSLISIALWLVPAIVLSAAWALGAGLWIGWPILAINMGVMVVSFVPPVGEAWNALVSKLLAVVLRLTLSSGDRDVEQAAERIWKRLWIATCESLRSGLTRFSSDLSGIRKAAEDLPTDDVGRAQLRHALLALIDALSDQAAGADFSVSTEITDAFEELKRLLYRFRCRSVPYRVMTIRRTAD